MALEFHQMGCNYLPKETRIGGHSESGKYMKSETSKKDKKNGRKQRKFHKE